MSWLQCFRRKRELPLWLKMFTGTEPSERHFVDAKLLMKMVNALVKGKKIICMLDGEPIEIYLDGKEVKIDKIENYKYVLK